jgi:hypothetical protein
MRVQLAATQQKLHDATAERDHLMELVGASVAEREDAVAQLAAAHEELQQLRRACAESEARERGDAASAVVSDRDRSTAEEVERLTAALHAALVDKQTAEDAAATALKVCVADFPTGFPHRDFLSTRSKLPS